MREVESVAQRRSERRGSSEFGVAKKKRAEGFGPQPLALRPLQSSVRLHRALIRNHLAGLHLHLERQRRVAGRRDLDAVRAARQRQRLTGAVEVADDSGIGAVDVDRAVRRRNLQRDAAVVIRIRPDDDRRRRRAVAVDLNRIRLRVGVRDRVADVDAESQPEAGTEDVRPVRGPSVAVSPIRVVRPVLGTVVRPVLRPIVLTVVVVRPDVYARDGAAFRARRDLGLRCDARRLDTRRLFDPRRLLNSRRNLLPRLDAILLTRFVARLRALFRASAVVALGAVTAAILGACGSRQSDSGQRGGGQIHEVELHMGPFEVGRYDGQTPTEISRSLPTKTAVFPKKRSVSGSTIDALAAF